MSDKKYRRQKKIPDGISRRDFFKCTGIIIIGAGAFGSCVFPDKVIIPASKGYLLVDTKKCQTCMSCMLACSLVHVGVENLSLSRIQIIQNSFNKWPDDKIIGQCRQCVHPACVKICPVGALTANNKYGNVRIVDEDQCIGCGKCAEACPYIPRRAVVVPDVHTKYISQKCDLCVNTPYHWDKAGGGPEGKQACVEVCPVGAIEFTKEVPVQEGDSGYNVNLRGGAWRDLGYPTD